MSTEKKVRAILIGAGNRGTNYVTLAKESCPEFELVAIADGNHVRRDYVQQMHGVPDEACYDDFHELLAKPRMADLAIIATQDRMHRDPALQLIEKGYNLLLEKPMAPTARECRDIVRAVKEAGVIFAVCHVLRYTPFSRLLKKTLASGTIGDLVSIQHLEPVMHWHQAHSFVRGNWRNEKESSFMLLAKCCHDLDWIRYMMDVPCEKVQSFGFLKHFTRENQPEGAASRCTDCPADIESRCPYSALQIYLRDRICKGKCDWPVDILTSDLTQEGVLKALREGPYGRCVYCCDNDVVDNQVVNFAFSGGSTGFSGLALGC